MPAVVVNEEPLLILAQHMHANQPLVYTSTAFFFHEPFKGFCPKLCLENSEHMKVTVIRGVSAVEFIVSNSVGETFHASQKINLGITVLLSFLSEFSNVFEV